jgi:sRNA-binding regulator protein Hfq
MCLVYFKWSIYNVLSVNNILLRKEIIYIKYKHAISYIVFNLQKNLIDS